MIACQIMTDCKIMTYCKIILGKLLFVSSSSDLPWGFTFLVPPITHLLIFVFFLTILPVFFLSLFQVHTIYHVYKKKKKKLFDRQLVFSQCSSRQRQSMTRRIPDRPSSILLLCTTHAHTTPRTMITIISFFALFLLLF